MSSDIQIFLPKTNPSQPETNTSSPSPSQNPFTGLYNHGNTCYLNSLLQTLYMTPQFKTSILKWQYNSSSHPSKPDCIPYQLKKLFSRMQLRLHPIEETIPLTRSFQWHHNEILEQNDIQELLHLLLDAINEKFIYDIFQGKLCSSIKCSECSHISTLEETFIDLSLPVKTSSKHLCDSLQQSFMNLFTHERLENENKYFCEKCNCKVNAEKYYSMSMFPQVLICALNRFEYNCKFDCKKKINHKLMFPFTFNVKDYIPNDIHDIKYELYSIIAHCGSARGGHYYVIMNCGGKWFKFDDSYVHEVDIANVIEVLYGSEQTDTSAYMLLYKNTSVPINNESNVTVNEIDEDVINEINKDEDLYKQKQEEEKERMSYVSVSTFYNGKYGNVKIKKYETVFELKKQICELYNVSVNNDDCRLRVFNSKNNKILDILTNESLTLEQINANSAKVYNLETREPNQQFSEFNPNIILIKAIVWDDSFTKVRDADVNVKQIEIDRTLSYDKCVSYLQKELHLRSKTEPLLLIMKKRDYGVNNFSFVEYTSSTTEPFLEENMKLYIEQCKTININESKFKKMFESEIALVKVVFNTPLDPKKYKKITVKSYSFNHSIEINPRKTISELRSRLSEVVNVPIDNFIMKKNSHNGVEIKKYNDTIDKYTSKSLTLYLQIGKPVQPTDMKLRFQYYEYDNTVFALYPYKISDIGEHVINKTWTVMQLLKHFEQSGLLCKETELHNANSNNSNSNNSEYKLYLRKENNFKPGSFYNENDVIEQSDIKENQLLILQYIKQKNVFNFSKEGDNVNSLVQFGVRMWDHNKWDISDMFELVVNKTISVEVFVTQCLNTILEKNGIDVSYQNIVGTKIYNQEMHYYMDEVEKMEFFPFVDFYSSLIENYPFMLNCDSCLLLIKDLAKEYRQPTAKEKEFFYKKSTLHSHNKKQASSTVTSHTNANTTAHKTFKPLKKEVYKEKAMVITVKQKQIDDNELSSSSNTDTLINT